MNNCSTTLMANHLTEAQSVGYSRKYGKLVESISIVTDADTRSL